MKENFLVTDPSASPRPEVRKNKRIQNLLFPHDGNRRGKVLDYCGRQRKKRKATISQNMTMSRRTGLTSSNRLRIKRCRSHWKVGSKFYKIGSKNHGRHTKKHKAKISQKLTMSRRMGLTSSNGLRIKRCRSRWKVGSKFYTVGSKNHRMELVIFI